MFGSKKPVLITKADGVREEFDDKKLIRSLSRSGASEEVSKYIAEHVASELSDGMTTDEIYKRAFELLRTKESEPAAARYSLKRAVLDLGPSGFPFEDFVSEIYRAKGYSVMTGTMIEGACAPHEVDVLATSEKHKFAAEVKFHNKLGFKTDLKVALYVYARFDDIIKGKDKHDEMYQISEGFLITNTRFSQNVKEYAKCVGIKLVGWDYPKGGGLQDLIEETGLHPITCLTTLSDEEKRRLLDSKNVLCKSIKNSQEVLLAEGIAPKRAESIMKEAAVLCQPGTAV